MKTSDGKCAFNTDITQISWGKFKVGITGLKEAIEEAKCSRGYSNTEAIGAVLYTEYVYPFQLAAVVLLISIVAAIALTMRRRPGPKTQDVSRQVAVRREDRVRLVKVETEGEK